MKLDMEPTAVVWEPRETTSWEAAYETEIVSAGRLKVEVETPKEPVLLRVRLIVEQVRP